MEPTTKNRVITDWVYQKQPDGRILPVPVYGAEDMEENEQRVVPEPVQEFTVERQMVEYIWLGLAFGVAVVMFAFAIPYIVEWFAGQMARTAQAMERLVGDLFIVVCGLVLCFGPPAALVMVIRWKIGRAKRSGEIKKPSGQVGRTNNVTFNKLTVNQYYNEK